jgi:hypothetical protein
MPGATNTSHFRDPFTLLPVLRAAFAHARLRLDSALQALDLGETAIYKQFRSRDVVAVFGCEKDHGSCDLIGCTEPAERNAGGNILHELVGPFYGMPWGRAGIAWAHGVHANAAMLQVGGPRAREGTHGGLGCAVDTPLGRGRFAAGGGRIQDDRPAIRH